MDNCRLFLRRAAPACAILALGLAGCGGNDPTAASGSMSRSAATVMLDPMPQEAYGTALQHLYVAYFGRPGEPAGMFFWNQQLEAAVAPPDAAALAAQYGRDARVRMVFDAFANSAESQALYPGATAQFVDGVYRNLFKRSAELPGLSYWANAIDDGTITRSEAALAILLGARGEDAQSVRNKIAVSTSFYAQLKQSSRAQAYTGNRNNEIARRMLAMVDARTDLAAFEAIIRATIEEMEKDVTG